MPVLHYVIHLEGNIYSLREDNYFLEQLRDKEQIADLGSCDSHMWVAALTISRHNL